MAFVGDGIAGITDEGLGGKFFTPNKVTTVQKGGNSDRIFDENVYHNMDTGELYKQSPVNDPNKIFDNQPGSVTGSSDTPGTQLTPVSSTGDNLVVWGSEFDNLPQADPKIDPNLNISGLSGQGALASPSNFRVSNSQSSPSDTTVSSPPTPPSTRPYIWKYQ